MQTTQAATTQTAQTAVQYFGALPWYLQLGIALLFVGFLASTITAQLRAAFPAEKGGLYRVFYILYPAPIGSGLAVAAYILFPGYDLISRALWGLFAPYALAPLYEYYKRDAEKKLGITLPTLGELTSAPKVPPTEGQKT